MAITVALTTAIGQVRYIIGDDVEGTGVLPNAANYTDAQIQYELTAADDSITEAAAALSRNLARRWTTAPQSFTADGLSVNRGDIAAKWTALAEQLSPLVAETGFTTGLLNRQDGYAAHQGQSGSDIDRDAGTSEY